MKRTLAYFFPLLSIMIACETNPVMPTLVSPHLSGITYEQTGYDLFSVRHSITTNDMTNRITAIVVGEFDNSAFSVVDSIPAVYEPSGNTYTLHFETAIPTSSSKSLVNVRTRYYFSSGSWTDFDTTLFTLRYPYPRCEFVLKTQDNYFAEDIDISDSVLYGQINDYILMYDMRTGATSQSMLIHSYECLTVVENRYIIYDHANWPLYRFDLQTNTTEMFVYHPEGRFLLGIESYGGFIYELLHDQLAGNRFSLLKYSLSGSLLDSVAIDHYVYRLTIHDNIAYVQRGTPIAHIERFDLSTNSFLDQFKAPSPNYEGIRIRGGYFYFSDFAKRTIARFPLEDLFTYGVMESG